jgi:hypothetical protein
MSLHAPWLHEFSVRKGQTKLSHKKKAAVLCCIWYVTRGDLLIALLNWLEFTFRDLWLLPRLVRQGSRFRLGLDGMSTLVGKSSMFCIHLFFPELEYLERSWLTSFTLGFQFVKDSIVVNIQLDFQFGMDKIIAKKKTQVFCVAYGMSQGASLDCFVELAGIIFSWPLVVAPPLLPGFTVPLFLGRYYFLLYSPSIISA